MARDCDGVGSYIGKGDQCIDAAVDYPGPCRADAKFCIGKKAIESSVAIFIFVVSGSFGAINACGDVATCQNSLDDIVAEITPAPIEVEENWEWPIAARYPE